MIWITEVGSGNKIAVNPDYVIAVFGITEGENQGKTAITLTNGNILADESDYDIVAMLKA